MKWFFPFVSFLATPLFSFQRAVPFLLLLHPRFFFFFLHICFLADMQAFRAGNKKFPALFVYLYVDKEDGSIITK